MTGPGPLRVDADLRVEVGGCSATVTGSGHRVVVEAENPVHLWSELNRSSLLGQLAGVPVRRSVAHVASALAAAGVQVEVTGPNGPLVRLGSGVDSALGRVATGSSAVRPAGVRALAPIAWHALRHNASRLALVGLVLASAAVTRESLRRRRG